MFLCCPRFRNFSLAVPFFLLLGLFFTRPESDYWQSLSLTDSATEWRLVHVIDVTLACEDANSKHVEVFTVAYVDEDCVGNSLLQIWKLRVGELLFRL